MPGCCTAAAGKDNISFAIATGSLLNVAQDGVELEMTPKVEARLPKTQIDVILKLFKPGLPIS